MNQLAAEFDPEQVGTPTVNLRGGVWFIIDGQHRIDAMRAIGWDDQSIQCWTYEGLTEQEEAEKFLKLNDYLVVRAYAKFIIALTAQRPEETDINKIVQSCGLHISQARVGGAIGAVAALRKVYRRGPAILARSLCIIRDSYGDTGLEGPVIEGIGLLCDRYNGQLSDERAVRGLSGGFGGVSGLLSKAEVLRRQTQSPRTHCVAAAAVDTINKRPGRKLPSWWKDEPEQ